MPCRTCSATTTTAPSPIEWLQGTLGGATRAQAYAVGLLVADQRQEAERLRGRWRPAWHHLDHQKRTAWLGR